MEWGIYTFLLCLNIMLQTVDVVEAALGTLEFFASTEDYIQCTRTISDLYYKDAISKDEFKSLLDRAYMKSPQFQNQIAKAAGITGFSATPKRNALPKIPKFR